MEAFLGELRRRHDRESLIFPHPGYVYIYFSPFQLFFLHHLVILAA